MATNTRFNQAKEAKKDEFYTRLEDIENELKHYKSYFKNKVVLCNCDDPRVSNFFRYFSYNFETLGLKRLIATCYKNCEPDLFSTNDSEQACYIIYDGDKNGNKVPDPSEMEVLPLNGDGDFRSQECIELLKQSDIVCTNPPFSLFKEYMMQLIRFQKDFIILGTMNAIHYTEIFPYIKDNKIWCGYTFNKTLQFTLPDSYEKFDHINERGEKIGKVPAIVWFTNIDTNKRHEELILIKKYTPEEYPKYDNLDAINIDNILDIPYDYNGMMGVPDSFLAYYNPDQFEILGADCIPQYADSLGIKRIGEEWMKKYRECGGTGHYTANMRSLVMSNVNGKPKKVFSRIIIKRK